VPATHQLRLQARAARQSDAKQGVSPRNEIDFDGHHHPVGRAGQKVGIKEVDEGIWLVSFMRYDLGYFDLEQKTLQPLDNPFGTRLSPMS
jgi:hypothetical protein